MIRLVPLLAGAAYGAWTGWRSNGRYLALEEIAPGDAERSHRLRGPLKGGGREGRGCLW